MDQTACQNILLTFVHESYFDTPAAGRICRDWFSGQLMPKSKSKWLRRRGIVTREDNALFVAHDDRIQQYRYRNLPEDCTEFDEEQFEPSDSVRQTNFVVCGLRFSFVFRK
jgi:hypothetical protein